jgi:hypothetical protein
VQVSLIIARIRQAFYALDSASSEWSETDSEGGGDGMVMFTPSGGHALWKPLQKDKSISALNNAFRAVIKDCEI